MDARKNFMPRITYEEAVQISCCYCCIDKVTVAYNCYCKAVEEISKYCKDIEVVNYCSHLAVYVMGYISGCRAIRDKKKS